MAGRQQCFDPRVLRGGPHRENRARALDVMSAALAAVDPQEAVRRHLRREGDELWVEGQRYDLGRYRHVYVAGAGKASAAMAAAIEELRQLIDRVKARERLGVCFDTCHVFASGYELRTSDGYEATMGELDRVIGLKRVRAFHLNDSKGGLGSHLDRHEHIGQGQLGLDAFRWLLNDPRWAGLPMVLETDKSKDLHEDVENLRRLRGLIGP